MIPKSVKCGSLVRMEVKLDAVTGRMSAEGSASVTLGHHQASKFLQALVLAMQAGKAVSAGAMSAVWRRADRTATRRLVEAVEVALGRLPDGAARLAYEPRHKTVGPWRLVCSPEVQWTLINTPPPGVSLNLGELPQLVVDNGASATSGQAPNLLNAVQAIALADDESRRAQYVDAAERLAGALKQLPLAAHGKALVALKRVHVLRREGSVDTVREALAQAVLFTKICSGRAADGLRAECAALVARTGFEQSRHTVSQTTDFINLWHQAQDAPAPRALWQWANLYALATRRELAAQHGTHADGATRSLTHVRALGLFEAALYWLLEAGDAYHLQAIVINFADYLCRAGQWLDETNDNAILLAHGLKWYSFGHMVVDRFDLPQDSAWDFIMLGAVYLDNAEGKRMLDQAPLAWPAQHSPAELSFYQTSVALADRFGDASQKVFARDQLAKWHYQSGEQSASYAATQEVEKMLQQDEHLAWELRADGFTPFRWQ